MLEKTKNLSFFFFSEALFLWEKFEATKSLRTSSLSRLNFVFFFLALLVFFSFGFFFLALLKKRRLNLV
jgi:hypothetical protein